MSGLCQAREPLSSCRPSHLSLLPQDGDLKPRCFIGARQRVRGLGEAGLLPRVSVCQPQTPSALGTRVCRPELPAPSPPSLLAHRTGAPFAGHPLVAVELCAQGHSLSHGTDKLATAWHSLSSPAPQQPCSGAGQVKYLPQCWSGLVLQLALLQLWC